MCSIMSYHKYSHDFLGQGWVVYMGAWIVARKVKFIAVVVQKYESDENIKL